MQHTRSLYAYIISVLLILYASFVFYPRWNKSYTSATISWDASGYYWPLPAFLIYKDWKQQRFADSIINKYQLTPDFQQAMYFQERQVYLFRYTFGAAILYFPFFITAHLLAKPLGYDADGFSQPYQFAI